MRNDSAEEMRALFRRADDLCLQCSRGNVSVSSYLTPREAHALDGYLKRRGVQDAKFFWGGYPDAERTRLFLLPGYLGALFDAENELDMSFGTRGGTESSVLTKEGIPVSLVDSYTDGAVRDAVAVLQIKGSGYCDLCHRDYLGALLALGVERDAFGDIAVLDSHTAVLFCDGRMVRFLKENLKRVGNDAVKLSDYALPPDFNGNREVVPIRDTVASERLDCVVAALTGQSRESAKDLILSGLCEVDYETADKPDADVIPPCRLSVRGYGRFDIHAFDGETKKGRLRLCADKYV